MSQYDTIWTTVKQAGSASVTVSNGHARTVEDGVKRIKSAENVARRKVGLVGWSKLTISRTQLSATMQKLTFTLLYRTDL